MSETPARAEILDRIRAALGTDAVAPPVPRAYRHTGERDPGQRIETLIDRLEDYKAEVVRCSAETGQLGDAVLGVLSAHGAGSVVAPSAVLEALQDLPGMHAITDSPELTPTDLDAVDAVVTGAALAIADTGVLVLDGDQWCGRRAITLVPDLHICIVRVEQIVDLAPEAVSRLDPTRPQTWIAGPSATSDIELDRVEGVHGPRTLVVVLMG